MKVKFLRDLGTDKKDSIKEVEDARANYWVGLGIVEAVDGKKSAPVKKTPTKKTSKR